MTELEKVKDPAVVKLDNDAVVRSRLGDVRSNPCDADDCKAARLAYESALDRVDAAIGSVVRIAAAQSESVTASGGLAAFAIGLGIVAATIGTGGVAAVVAAGAVTAGIGSGFFALDARAKSPGRARVACDEALFDLSTAKRAFIRTCPSSCLPNPFPQRFCP